MCISLPLRSQKEKQRLYVALYDDAHRDLDWALVVVSKSDTRPIPAPPSNTVVGVYSTDNLTSNSVLAGGEYGIFRIRSTLDDVEEDILHSSESTLVSEYTPPHADQHLQEQYHWEFEQRRVECPEKDPSLVALFHVANLSGSREVARLVKFLRALPSFPPTSAHVSDGEYVFIDTNEWGLPSTQDTVTAPAKEKQYEAHCWDSTSWVQRVLDHLRPKHPEMPSKDKLTLVIDAIGPKLREHYLDGHSFSYAVRAIDVRMTPNVRGFPFDLYSSDYLFRAFHFAGLFAVYPARVLHASPIASHQKVLQLHRVGLDLCQSRFQSTVPPILYLRHF